MANCCRHPGSGGKGQVRDLAVVPFAENEHVNASGVIARIGDPPLALRSCVRGHSVWRDSQRTPQCHMRRGGSAAERPFAGIGSKSLSAMMAS